MYFVYILFSAQDKKFYIGYTKDLERRLVEHQKGWSYTTSRLNSPELIYYESFICGSDAKRRERYFKTSKGKKTLRLMLRGTLAKYFAL